MASVSGTAERPTPLHSATPYPPIIAYPLSAGLLPEGRQYSTMVQTHTPPTSTEGTGYPLPTTTPYSSNNINCPPMVSTRNHHFPSTHRLSPHLPQEQEASTDRDLPLLREPGTRADRRAGDLPSWTSAIIPERKGTIFDHAPLAGSFSGDLALAVGDRHPHPHSHSASSEEAVVEGVAWRHHMAGSARDQPRAPVALPGLSSMPSLAGRPDLGLPRGAMGMGMGVDSRSLRYGLTPQEREQAGEVETEMRTEMRMLTEMRMIDVDGGYRHDSSDSYGNGNEDGGVIHGYGGGGMDMYWHPTSSLPIKVESPPP
jgi:hypothetical protein